MPFLLPALRGSFRTYLLIGTGLIAALALILLGMGRVPWCECGYVKLWHGLVSSPENSQHISDWYTFSHIIHGFGFYWILWRLARGLPMGLRAVIAVIAEASWETFENTEFILNRYRAVTISLGYYGDSVINSMGDVLAMGLGFALAARLPVWATIALTAALEGFVGYWIRDNLALNILMLIHPFEAIRTWQLGG
ncbi:MAG TPA: DUF2585 domain-containing protein [Candidatus Methylomirabilis sp.]|jgi:hypothetical protein|nr:DUF2585 domain-containing protein [Candidatus Methylomirabilis sp.]